MKHMHTLAVLAASTLGAHAAIVAEADSSGFDYLYEMDTNPATLDLDSNSTNDWFGGTVSGATIPQTYTGGVAYSNDSAGENLFRVDFGGSILRNNFSDANPMTMELSVSKQGGSQGTLGWFGAALQMPGASNSIVVAFADDHVKVRETGGGYSEYLNGTDFTSGFHTMRVAKEGGDNYYIWIDDVLLNADLSTPIGGGNGNFNSGGSWFIGDYSSGGFGSADWGVDYIRMEADGAFAPVAVPEPSSAVLLGLGGAALILRRRK
ncbi:PEP-CTERM sorting domain-containing protein [Sulfuriroseicoccus oceanibius]|uniref:PEP-CTERM sorting domain-containing protein n=1 Tax=Sulfuriroseicoccus oceanibius TaxID=2707525 RepID=A0A6B3LEM5_9BACT|nr:PEP-CTERM sorting domain-containing protein [Sulfuriroseicoccus oceanibius]QQL44945.1 PEP-CTERM sorting domain-containing protein [Sulfuriroseicoccus oceanibius]